MDENQFWSTIESAWQTVGGKTAARRKLAEGKLSEERAEDRPLYRRTSSCAV